MAEPITAKQLGFIQTLLRERVPKDPEFKDRCEARIKAGTLTKQLASEAISYLLKQPKDPSVPIQYPRTPTRFKPNTAMAARTAAHVLTPLAHAGTNVAQASHPAGTAPKVTKPGVFKRPDGEIFVAKPNRLGTRTYAKRMVPISAERLNLLGNKVKFEFEYEPGMIYTLDESMRLGEDQVAALCLQYGRCIMCNHPLKAAKSVQRMIGPVCYERVQGIGLAP